MRPLALALLLLAGSARAQVDESSEKAQARLLLGQGNALFEKGDLRGALVDFRAAYAIYPSPKLLVNAAACERELGDLAAAANDLRHFLDDDAGDDPPLSDKARTELRALAHRLGRVTLAGWPSRTAVEIDGRPGRDTTYVRPGAHHLYVRAPDSSSTGESPRTVERDLELGAGETFELSLPARARPSARVERRSRWWIGLVVAGSALLVGGAVTLGVVYGTRSEPAPLRGDLGTVRFSDFR